MRPDERGQITVVSIGFLLLLGLLVVVVVDSSAVFLQRQALDNTADGAALAAADGLDRGAFYRRGDVELDAGQARRLVGAYVQGDVEVTQVTIDDDQVHVRLERTVGLAFAPPGWGERTTIVAEATARLALAGQAVPDLTVP